MKTAQTFTLNIHRDGCVKLADHEWVWGIDDGDDFGEGGVEDAVRDAAQGLANVVHAKGTPYRAFYDRAQWEEERPMSPRERVQSFRDDIARDFRDAVVETLRATLLRGTPNLPPEHLNTSADPWRPWE